MSIKQSGFKNKDFISVPQFAKLFKVSKVAIYNRINRGQIDAIRPGHNILIPSSEIEKFERLENKQTRCLEKVG